MSSEMTPIRTKREDAALIYKTLNGAKKNSK
jgi:hypothetical protein